MDLKDLGLIARSKRELKLNQCAYKEPTPRKLTGLWRRVGRQTSLFFCDGPAEKVKIQAFCYISLFLLQNFTFNRICAAKIIWVLGAATGMQVPGCHTVIHVFQEIRCSCSHSVASEGQGTCRRERKIKKEEEEEKEGYDEE